MSINMILATGLNGELGQTSSPNGLPWKHNPEDMKFFKKMTKGTVVVMGGNTFRQLQEIGFENGIPDRKNVVLSSSGGNYLGLNRRIVNHVSDFDWLISEGFNYFNSFADLEVFIIGGKSIYNQFHQYCDKVYLTRINQEFPDADVKINLAFLEDFDMIETIPLNDYSKVEVYKRK